MVKLEKNRLIDIHSHILHGVDDGARNVAEAVEMVQIAANNGITAICLTPHFQIGKWTPSIRSLQKKFEEIQSMVEEFAPDLELFLGNEMFFCETAFEALQNGNCLTLAGSLYVLVEFHPQEHYRQLRQSLLRIMEAGFSPILAHVERYDCLRKDFENLEALVRMGVYLQVNSRSILKGHGLGGSGWIRKLMRKELVHFIATDCHDTGSRSPALQACVKLVEKKYGVAYANRLFANNPEKVLKNEVL